MKVSAAIFAFAALLQNAATNSRPQLVEEPYCVEGSPERHGEIGCSIIEKKTLPADFKDPAFWHINRFDRAEPAQAAVGPTTIAFQAQGSWWLLSVRPATNDHHGGKHVAEVKRSPLPKATNYSIAVISAYIPSGMTAKMGWASMARPSAWGDRTVAQRIDVDLLLTEIAAVS
jgi:hypothetical protein